MIRNLKNIFLFKHKVILIVLFISILLSFLPLTDVFSYEFAIIQGVILSLVFGLMAIKYSSLIGNKLKRNTIVELLVLLFIPMFVSIISTKLGQNCPLSEGFQFYFVITIISAVFGFALGIIIPTVFKKWNRTTFLMFWSAALLFPIVEIFYNPQIYLFNPILGFFPGTIYDEDIAVNLKMLSYRAVILLFSIIVIRLSIKLKNSKNAKKAILFLSVLLSVALFLFIKPELGFASTIGSIESKLYGKVSTPHFTIIYSSRIPKKEIKNIALHHEYYYHVLSSVLKDSIAGKITSFVFYSNAEKRKLFGAGNADVAKPWLKQIYTTREHFDATLKHELAHIFSANYGWSVFKVAKDFNPAMIEGFATALSNNFGNSDIDYVAANAKNSGMNLNINKLFSGFNFFDQTSSISYVYAGSFIKFLLHKYGAEHVEKVYSDLDFSRHFHKNLTQLSTEFENYLNSIHTTPSKNKAQLYFKRMPIQKRVCVRYTANKLNKAWQLYSLGAYPQSEEMFNNIYKYSGAYSALLGESLSLKSNNYFERAVKLLQANVERFEGTSYYFNLLKNLGDVQILNRHYKTADSTFSLLKKLRPSQDYYDVALFRLKMLRSDSSKARMYVRGSLFDKYSIVGDYNFAKIKFNVIPIMLILSAELNRNYSKFIEDYKNISFDSTYSSAYSAFKLSKYAKDNNDFKSAIYFAEKSLLLKGKEGFRKILEANLQKDLWMKSNSKFYYEKMKFIR